MEPSAVEPVTSNSSNGRNGSTTKGRPMPPATAACAPSAQPNIEQQPQQGPDMTEAIIDLSSYDWLAFPHWAKAVELDNFPRFLLWLTEQDAVLAGTVAVREEEFQLVFDKIKREMKTEGRGQGQATKGPTT